MVGVDRSDQVQRGFLDAPETAEAVRNTLRVDEVDAADEEEEAEGLTAVVPFLLESTLTQRGAIHASAAVFQPHVEVDGRLVTAQNPASAAPLAEALVGVLRAEPRPPDIA